MIAPRDDFTDGGSVPRYSVGQNVRHRRYGYRGVIVACDSRCQAADAWYWTNQTQPARHQPWYHVLVDESDQTTYAAQENLEDDPNKNCIVHPWVTLFFDRFENGRYERNDKPFPPV